jgi:hypothetical protein
LTAIAASLTGVVLAAELVVWATLVPRTLAPGTFAGLNSVLLVMFAIGFASAAKGLPVLSIAQTLHEVEHPAA